MELVTGRSGSPHITAQQDRQLHQGIFGAEAYILNTGNKLEPEVQSSNKIHIKDGALMFQGALFSVKVGTYDEVTINNGNQGMERKDVIAVKYMYDSSQNIESAEWAVVQGTPVANNPMMPDMPVTDRDIQAGDSEVYCPVFVVTLDGINVTGVDVIPDEIDDIVTLKELLEPSDWTSIGTANRMTARYRNNGHACEVEMDGSLGNAGLPAWESFQIGTLPEGMRPSMTMMVPSCIPGKYMMQIETDGKVLFVATSTFSGSNDHVRAQCMYFI